jgi:beta-barrel assembly-enhancing protease
MKSKLLLTFVSSVFLISGCSRNPVTGEKEISLISSSQEIALGVSEYGYMQQAEGGRLADEKLNAYVQEVGRKLVEVSDRKDLPYEFVVLNNSVPNAWSLPGGKIGINRGLLLELNSEAELAAVLSHEIVHSAARHAAKHVERGLLMTGGLIGLQALMRDNQYEDVAVMAGAVGAGLISLKYSRMAELQADSFGIKYMAAAGYDPQASVALQETFLRLSGQESTLWLAGLFATHPPSQERLAANQETSAKYSGGAWNEKEYQEAIADLKNRKSIYEDLDNGYAALKRGDHSEALSYAEKGIARFPDEAHLYNLKGKSLLLQDDFEGALKAFDQAISLNPDYFDFYLQRGLVKEQMGQSGRTDLEKSLQLLPSAKGEYALGLIHLKQGRHTNAIVHFTKAANHPSEIGDAAREQLALLH